MLVSSPRHNPRSATAAVEFAVCAPFILLLLLGVWEVGRMCQVTQILENAAREGVRQAAIGVTINGATGDATNITTTNVQDTVIAYVTRNGLPAPTTAQVEFYNLTAPGKTQPYDADSGDLLRVQITYPKANWNWAPLTTSVTGAANLYGSAVWASAKDKQLIVDVNMPIN